MVANRPAIDSASATFNNLGYIQYLHITWYLSYHVNPKQYEHDKLSRISFFRNIYINLNFSKYSYIIS